MREPSRLELESLRAAIDLARDGWYLADRNGVIVDVNRSGCTALGYAPGELLHRPLSAINDRVTPERMAEVWRTARAGTPVELNGLHRRKDGSSFPVELSIRHVRVGVREYLSGFARDVTERDRAERALRESEDKYRFLTEESLVGTWVIQDGKMAYVNRSFAAMWGYTPEEIMRGMRPEDLFDPSDRARLQARMAEKLAGRNLSEHSRYTATRKDGSVFRVETFGLPVAFQGRPAFLGTAMDITERERALEDLRESEERLRSLSDMSEEGVMVHADGIVLDANRAFVRMIGLTEPGELIARQGLDVIPFTPESRAMVVSRMRSFSVEPYEVILARPDGKRVLAEVSARQVSYRGRQARLVLMRDVTERTRVRQDLTIIRRALDESRDFWFLMDRRGVIQFVNGSGCRALGYGRSELIDRRIGLVIPRATRRRWEEVWKLTKAGRIFPTRSQLRCKDGSTLAVELVPQYLRVGEEEYLTGYARDVAERDRLEDQMRQMQKSEAVGVLAGGVAHDFNNMLGVILSSVESGMLRTRPGDVLRPILRNIQKAGLRSAELTRSLLAYGRRQPLHPEPFDLNSRLRDLATMIKPLLGEAHRLELFPAPGGAWAAADPRQVDHVVMNLAVNGRDAMPRGGRITIRTESIRVDAASSEAHGGAAPGRYVLLSVTDTGIGMDRDTVLRIFDPYFTTKPKGRGTGLGLATVYGIVRQSGGTITVESEPGKGSTFKVRFPSAPSRPPRGTGVPARGRRAAGLKVLLVEDDDLLRAPLRDMLLRLGHEVRTASGGAPALRLVREGGAHPDLLLTDVVMQGMDGEELARRLRQLVPGLRVILMSGYPGGLQGRRQARRGTSVRLQKPFTSADLAAAIRGLAGLVRASRAAGKRSVTSRVVS